MENNSPNLSPKRER